MRNNIFAVELSAVQVPKNIFEKASLRAQDLKGLYQLYRKNNQPFFILNTCRRLAIYTAGTCPGKSIRFFEDLDIEKKYLKKFKAEQAAEHLFTVAAGLDSPNLGENEIMHQVKTVFQQAISFNSLDTTLYKLLQKTIETGKKVRSQTEIAKTNLTYPALINAILTKHFNNLSGKNILIIGNGKLGKSCIQYFLNKKCNVTLATRNPEKGRQDYTPEISFILRNEVLKNLNDYHIIIGAASVENPIIYDSHLKRLKGLTVFFDLGTPANIEFNRNQLNKSYLYSLDDIFRENNKIEQRKSIAVEKSKKIIRAQTKDFEHWLKSRKAAEIIHTLKEELEQIKIDEQIRLLKELGDLGYRQKKLVEGVVERLTSRIAHTHYTHIKNFVVDEQS